MIASKVLTASRRIQYSDETFWESLEKCTFVELKIMPFLDI